MLALIIQNDFTIVIRRKLKPYLIDLANGCIKYAYPSLLLVLFYFFETKYQPHTFPYGSIAMLLFFSRMLYLPLLVRVVGGVSSKLILTINLKTCSILLNGVHWAEFAEVNSVKMLTCVGPLVYRRFRIELNCSRIKYLIIVDTPQVADWSAPSKYIQRVIADRQAFSISPWTDFFQWYEYQPGMGGYKLSDPNIREIFGIYYQLCRALQKPYTINPDVNAHLECVVS